MPPPLLRLHPSASTPPWRWLCCSSSSVAAVLPSRPWSTVPSRAAGGEVVVTPNPLSADAGMGDEAAGDDSGFDGSSSRPPAAPAAATAAVAAAPEEVALKVAVIVRPLLAREAAAQGADVLEVVSPQQIRVRVKDESAGERVFTFDAVLAAPPPGDVYASTAAYVLSKVLQGFNGCVFAYGQTGSGKTFTMEGSGGTARDAPRDAPGGAAPAAAATGVIQRVAAELFASLARSRSGSTVDGAEGVAGGPLRQRGGGAAPLVVSRVSAEYLEIYNDVVYDLLRGGGEGSEGGLALRQRADGAIYVEGATARPVATVEELLGVLSEGSAQRSRGETTMNSKSSRSHAVLTLHLVLEAPGDARRPVAASKLHLIDLAGSERQSKTGAGGERLKEAAGINGSLSALGNVISALTTPGRAHVPYRDSKLTRLLQDSLGGNAVTAMLCCVSPATSSAEETLSSLRFAERAKRVRNVARVNVALSKEDAARAALEELLRGARARATLLEAALAKRMGLRWPLPAAAAGGAAARGGTAADRAALEAELIAVAATL